MIVPTSSVLPVRIKLPYRKMTTLAPNVGSLWLPVATVTARAASEFACVATDEARAMKYFADRLVAMNPDIDEQAADEYLQPLTGSVEMICTDDRHSDEQFLKCLVAPEQPIEIVYHFDGHREAAADLLARLAHVLEYEITE